MTTTSDTAPPANRDDALRLRQFWLGKDLDPEELPDLLQMARTEGEEKPEFEYIYDRKPPKNIQRRRVHCGHCHRRNHFRGYVLVYQDGKRVLIGKDCGGDHYDLWFHKQAAEFERQITRAQLLKRVDAVRLAYPAALGQARAISDSSWLEAASASLTQFQRLFPKLSSRVLAASSGRLIAPVPVRDFDAEKRRDDRIDAEIRRRAMARGMDPEDWARQNQDVMKADPFFSKPPIEKLEDRQVGMLVAFRYASAAQNQPRARYTDALYQMTADADRLLELDTNDYDDTRLRELLKTSRQHLRQLLDIVERLSQGAEFFGRANLDAIASWLEKLSVDEGTYHSTDQGLVLASRSGKQYPLSIAHPVPAVITQLLRLEVAFE